MRKGFCVLMCLLGSLLVGVASSGADVRPYVRMSGLYVLPAESAVDNYPALVDGARVGINAIDLDSTLGVVGAVGLDWPAGFQIEIEGGYRSMDMSEASVSRSNGTSFTVPIREGKMQTLTVMVNGRYVFRPASSWWLNPYLGGGVGVALHDVDIEDTLYNGEDTVLAYQGLVGVEFDVSDHLVPHVGYRF